MVEPVPTSDSPDEPHLAVRQPASTPREIVSAEILQGAREVLIRHGEETYRLSLTRNGKLILHK
jgi:hemin uptake protein HemP